MKKKVGAILLGLFISAILGNNSFSQDEAGVMKRYDFSSPKASFESYKKAMQEKDLEGAMIHRWELGGNQMSPGMKFKDVVAQCENEPECREDWFKGMNELWTEKGVLKITEVDFVKELKRTHIVDNPKIQATICEIIVGRKSDGMQATVMVYNLDGTEEWWILNYPGGPSGE